MHPLDVHVFTPEEFEADAREELSFAWIIAKQARVYYWTEEAVVLGIFEGNPNRTLPGSTSSSCW
ncbi:hypothetical protein D3C73_1674380 [compost metagenome]